MHKIGMSIMISHPDKLSIDEQIPLFAEIGFDSFFLSSGVTGDFGSIPRWAKLAEENGMVFEAVHAPGCAGNAMWKEDADVSGYVSTMQYIIDRCSEGGVSKIVEHVAGGSCEVTDIGIKRYSALADYAEKKGVHMCYENGDVIPPLVAVVENSSPFHGFTLDIGHHLCYAPQYPLINRIGNRMMYTHIHDNMGIQRPGNPGSDMHMLPFDGILDWDWFAAALRSVNYEGTLNLELACRGKEWYFGTSYREFCTEAHKRIVKFREMVEAK